MGIAFVMIMRGFRPHFSSVWRTFAWSELYFVTTFVVDLLTGENYGYLLHKPEASSLLSLLSDYRPLYLFQMHLLALVFFLVLYVPFAIYDLVARNGVISHRRTQGTTAVSEEFPKRIFVSVCVIFV